MGFKLQKHENTETPPDHKNHSSKHAAHSGLSASSSDEQNPADTVAEACKPV